MDVREIVVRCRLHDYVERGVELTVPHRSERDRISFAWNLPQALQREVC